MKQTPIDFEIVKQKIKESGLKEVGKSSIREIVKLISDIEKATGQEYIHMEMGVPGLEPPRMGIDAEIEALNRGVTSVYPDIEGLPELKQEASRFAKLFLNIDISPKSCIPTVGSMQGSFAAFLVANRSDRNKEGTLFIDPCFPVHKQQCKILGQACQSFDLFNYRGDKLKDKLESYFASGRISTLLYSNPNNPSWMCLTEEELQIIGELATKYDVIVVEDLAYFAMDFRKKMGTPGKPPFQSTVAHYTDNYYLTFSGSKVFSYAGQRTGLILMSDKLYNRHYPDLLRYYSSDHFGHAITYGAIYALTAGAPHSTQYGMAAMLKAVNDGTYDFVKEISEYGRRAQVMKKMFIDNGFKIVYDKDIDQPVSDGFYFTIIYPGMNGSQLIEELLFYGISAISLDITGSEFEGLRACVSQFRNDQIPVLDERLKKFREHHPLN